MLRSIAVVHFEELSSGTRRLAALLEAEGLACDIRDVHAEDEFHRLLADERVDLALYTCGGRSGDPAALTRRIRGAAPSVPVIVLVGADDPALEVEILKAGAADCLATSRLGRLGWAIRRALAEREENYRRDRLQSELVSLEAQLHHAQRLEKIAQMAVGVAHDFNNLLMVINGGCQLLLLSVPESDGRRRLVEPIERAGARGAELTKRLLSFSRRESAATTLLNLNHIITDAQPMVTALLGETVRLSLNLDPSLWLVRADPGEMSQVLMNLVTNARDAMPDGGAVTIRTGNVDLLSSRATPSAGSHVELVVRDAGCGMEEHVRARIFDPFYTTKAAGDGTGLGLATVHRIVSHSGGQIDVETAAGRGTTMRVRLPRAEATDAVPCAPLADEVAPLAGTESVLVVEDERSVREIVCAILRDGGYRVLEAGDADAAEAICRLEQGAIDLLVSDVVMPGASGPRTAEMLREIVPGLKTLFISGYPADAISNVWLGRSTGFLAKPFSRDVLLQKVRTVLGSPVDLLG